VSIPPPRSPAECFAGILQWLTQAVATRHIAGLLAAPLTWLLVDRIRGIKQRFARLAARLRAGTYVPRRHTPRQPPAARKPRRPNPLPQTFGWLQNLLPEAVMYRSQLEHLLRDPEFVALMQAAPAPMARVLRPLCWMLRVTPPPVLARPRPPRRPSLRPAPPAEPPAADPPAAEARALPPRCPPLPPRPPRPPRPSIRPRPRPA